MDISSLPTDNLYKFTAITGLLVFLFFIAAPEYVIFNLEIKKAEVNANQQKLLAEVNGFKMESERLSRSIKIEELRVKEKFRGADQAESEKLAQLDAMLGAYNVLIANNKKFVEWQGKTYDQEVAVEHIRIMSDKINVYSIYAIIGRVFGFAMVVAGFCLWYFKTQRLLDVSLAEQQRMVEPN